MLTKITTIIWDVTAKENLGAKLISDIQEKVRTYVKAGLTDGKLHIDYNNPAVIQRCWANEKVAQEFKDWMLELSSKHNNPVKEVKIEDISNLIVTK
jgi:hypothetical protein